MVDEPNDNKSASAASAQQKPDGKQAPAAPTAPMQPERKFDGFLAEVVEVMPDKTGMFGSVTQVMCKILEGRDRGRVIRKNVTGRIKIGDQIRLADTSREDKPIYVK